MRVHAFPPAGRAARALLRLALVLAAAVAISGCTLVGMDPLVPAAISVVSGGGQSATVGAAAPSPLVVRVSDQYGSPLANAEVDWMIASGDGSLSRAASLTDSAGLAQVSFTAGATAGSVTVEASASGVGPVSFAVTVNDSTSSGT
jgi:hypothetical protein